ncbi:MAG UNVERIFIED_CONTAM: PIN domain-containing protein [Rickettsiaceae bacterium]|jgi:predicted nucleic-acid-binding protein
MIGIDTNVLVRYFTEDDAVQTDLAAKLIDRNSGKRCSVFINNIVICELIWVLLHLYEYNKPQIIFLLKEMLSTIEFGFEDHSILAKSIMSI